jgi:cell division topological specificity factor
MNRLLLLTPVSSAPVARERLQHLLEHDRRLVSQADLIAVLREDIYALVGRHGVIDPSKVEVTVARGATASKITVDIEVPNRGRATATTRRMHDGEGKNVRPYR